MVTPQTNTTLEEIAQKLSEYSSFAICGHVNPDGDCLGSQLALAHALRGLGKRVTCVLAKADPVDQNLAFLPGLDDMVFAGDVSDEFEVFVAVDVPTVERIGAAASLHDAAQVRFTIDHHAVDTAMAEFTYVDPAAPSTTMLVWHIVKALGVVTPDVAQCALCGLITDTGRFAYQNTTPEAFVLAAEMVQAGASPVVINREFFQNRSRASLELERLVLDRMEIREEGAFAYSYLTLADFAQYDAIKADAEPLIDVLRSIRGVRVALILRENAPGEVRGSLRSKDDITDVARVARVFDGGGHKAAAGFTYYGSIDQALDDVARVVSCYCFAKKSNDVPEAACSALVVRSLSDAVSEESVVHG